MGHKLHRRHGLTTRQREVLTGLRDGVSFVDIATELGVSRQRVAELAAYLVNEKLASREDGRYIPTLAGMDLLERLGE